jgi:allantoicase
VSNSKRRAHCNKVKHATLLAAQIALKRTLTHSRQGDPIITGLSAYQCPYCDGWHVGRSRKKGIDWAAFEAHEKALKARLAP